MSNRATHCFVGVGAGAVATGFYADRNSWLNFAFEVAGGCVGGYVGARMPDWIDPATSPNHRNWGHGGGTVAGLVWLSYDAIIRCQRRLRFQACCYERMAQRATDGFVRLGFVLWAGFLRSLAGMLAGFVAGYVSHLALDFSTPKGIPVVARGF